MFRGAGWNVIKVIWGGYWDPLLARDKDGLLLKRMEEASTATTSRTRRTVAPSCASISSASTAARRDGRQHVGRGHLALNRGGHDPIKVHAPMPPRCVTRDSRP